MIVGGYWFLSLRTTEPRVGAGRAPPRPRGSVLARPGMIVLAIVFVAMGSIFGATDVSTVAFADESGSKGLAGAILAVFALGSLISGLLYGTRQWKRPLYLRFANGMVLLAVGVCAFFFVHSLVALAAVMFVVGFAIAPTLINGNGLVQELVPRERLTEGLTWVGTSLGRRRLDRVVDRRRPHRRRRVARRVPRGGRRRRVCRRRDAGRAAHPARRRRRARARRGGGRAPRRRRVAPRSRPARSRSRSTRRRPAAGA